ncbi:hypothetical protein Bca4012_011522 [Brassica carinata]
MRKAKEILDPQITTASEKKEMKRTQPITGSSNECSTFECFVPGLHFPPTFIKLWVVSEMHHSHCSYPILPYGGQSDIPNYIRS